MTPAVLAAGFPGGSSYYRQADAALGMTARQFRRGGGIPTLSILSATVRSVAARSQKVNGACAPFTGEEDAALLDALSRLFPHARLLPGMRILPAGRFSPIWTILAGRLIYRWICAAPRFSSASGRRCARSRQERPAAIVRSRRALANPCGESRSRRLRGQ